MLLECQHTPKRCVMLTSQFTHYGPGNVATREYGASIVSACSWDCVLDLLRHRYAEASIPSLGPTGKPTRKEMT